ncbi:MAG: Rrf2 family transcriptional regulator [Candidatus Hinthialibacter antarcticus]|nr:Rrf2 family transcriptional regulator [Candidatus Hinthialibacter antarcticus]
MNLTRFTDYSLRVLLYLALRPNQRISISEITEFYGVSKDHLVKVVNKLGALGYIQTTRGRNGGIELAKPLNQITVGEVARQMEPHFHLVECFEPQKNHCTVTSVCHLKFILAEALEAFLSVLDRYTMENLVVDQDLAKNLLQIDD